MTRDRATDVVATGWAVESCIGRSPDAYWANLAAGTSGIRPITLFDASMLQTQIAGEVPGFDASELLPTTEVRRTTRAHHLLLSVATQAYIGADRGGDRVGLVVGSGGMGTSALAELMAAEADRFAALRSKAIDRLTLLKVLPSMPTSFVAQKLGITGPSLTVNSACASSTDALALGAQWVRLGVADAVLVAGVEAWINEFVIAAFGRIQALSTRAPEEAAKASRPFDSARDGMVPSEGAAALLLETRGRAERLGREPLCTVMGSASSNDAFHPVMPREDGSVAARTLSDALRDAGVAPDELSFVSAHGTSTPLNDVAETRALKTVLGEATTIPVTAPKSVIGHCQGASGIVEIIGAIMAIKEDFLPPTINLDTPDPDCDLDYVPNEGRPASLRTAAKCSFGFGGQNAVVVIGEPAAT